MPAKTKTAKRSMRPDDILRIRWVTDPQISPDGTRVAYVVTTLDKTKNEYRSSISVVDTKGGDARRLTNGPKRDTAPRWSPDGRHVSFLSERGDEKEKTQVWVIDAGGGEAWRLTKVESGASGAAVWSPDGKRVAFTSRVESNPADKGPDGKPYAKVRKISTLKYKSNGEGLVDDKRSHIFVAAADVDAAATVDATQVTRGDFNHGTPAWSPDGSKLAFVSARHATRDRDNASDIWVLDVPKDGKAAGQPRRLTKTLGPASLPAWSPDGKQVAYLGSAYRKGVSGRHGRLWVVAAAGRGDPKCLTAGLDRNCGRDVGGGTEPIWSPDGGSIRFGVLDGGNCHLYSTLAARPAPDLLLGGERQITASTQAKGGAIAFLATDPTHPAEVFTCAADGSGERRLSHENDAWLEEVELAKREPVKAVSADGTTVQAWAIRPPNTTGRVPCLLNVHGGPKTQYGSNFFDEFQVYAAAGYAVVYGNPRGSDGYSEDWSMAVMGAWGDKDWADIIAVADAAEALPFVDASRVGIMGGSYGGFMTSWAVGHTDRFRAACSERAVNNAYSMVGTSDIGFNFQIDHVGALPYRDPERFLRMSPINYADAIHTPLLILHSENDLRCPMEQAEQLYVALKLLRRPVEFWRFPEDNHEMSRSGKPRNRLKRFEVILSWFDRQLKK
ncbi:MAG TPA: S9 family peptidase [Dehalococcoidia bacterium]